LPERPPHRSAFFFVLNRASGSGSANEIADAITRAMDEAGCPYRLLLAGHPEQLEHLARQAVELAREANGVVVVAGGDGTINAVTQAVLPSGLPFGVLPQGTFNFFGRCHGLPEGDVAASIRGLLDAREKPVQVGLVNGRAFLVNASIGLYPDLLEEREQDKQRFGRHRWVALGSGLRALLGGYPRLHLLLRQDGQTRVLRATTLVVGNNRLQLERIGISQAAAVEQGQLVGIAMPPVARWRMIRTAVRGLLGHLGKVEQIEHFAFTELELALRRHRRIKLALDGEIIRLRLPLRFEVAPQPLRLLVPRIGGDAS
jgi:diacylglycerol kinase family enzyme